MSDFWKVDELEIDKNVKALKKIKQNLDVKFNCINKPWTVLLGF